MNWKLTLSYDGTGFHGWQVQPGLPTVQGLLSQALAQVTGEHVLPQGSGRTDAGVHALAQVSSFTLGVDLPPANLQRALNHALPASIRVLAAEHAAEDFHARHSATGKTYEYRIFDRRELQQVCSPFVAPFVWDCHWRLDFERHEQRGRRPGPASMTLRRSPPQIPTARIGWIKPMNFRSQQLGRFPHPVGSATRTCLSIE